MGVTFVLAACAFLLSFVLPYFITSKDPLMLFGFIRFSSSRSALNLWLQLSVVSFIPYTIYFFKINYKSLLKFTPICIVGFILGYLPNIIYKLSTKTEVYGHANFYLTKNISYALGSLWQVNLEKASFFTLSQPTKLAFYLTALLSILTLSVVSVRKIKIYEPQKSPVLIYLFSVIAGIFAFLLSAMTDSSSFRYLGSYMVVLPFILTFIYKSLYERKKGLAYVFCAVYFLLAIFQVGSYFGEKRLFTAKPVQHRLMDNNIPAFHELISVLKEKKIKYSFSDYWVSYILTFLSREGHISTPTKDKWIRMKSYLDDVTNSPRKAYIYRLRSPEYIKRQEGYKEVEEFQTSEFKVVVVEKKL
jgi:hypothetical protein